MADASRDEVVEWMATHRRGYKAAAKHFGLPVDTVKTWGRENRGVGSRPRARARADVDTPAPLRPPPIVRSGSHADRPGVPRFVSAPHQDAVSCVGELEPGIRVSGITKGQFSLIDLLRAILDQTGPAEVVISTWTTGIRDADTAAYLVESGAITSLMFLTDRSFPSRQPLYCRRLVELFGSDAIVCANVHAKFVLIRNAGWSIVVRASMNLTRNPRFETFDIDESAPMHAFYSEFVADVVANHRQGVDIDNAEVSEGFAAAMGGTTAATDRAKTAATVAAMIADTPLADPTTESRVEFLGRHLRELQADIRSARAEFQHSTVPKLLAEARATRSEYDTATAEGTRLVLDRTPSAVAEAVEERHRRIQQLIASRAAARERDL